MLVFISFIGALMVDLEQPDCLDNLGTVTIALLFCFMANSMLGTLLCLYVGYLFQTRAYTESDQMYVGRCRMLTVTTRNKKVFALAYLIDTISASLFVIECIYHSAAREHCREGFVAMWEIAMVLQGFILLRMFLFCVQFTDRRRPFYSWLKRRLPSLQSIESEQRVTLDVYRLEEYVAKLKHDVNKEAAAQD